MAKEGFVNIHGKEYKTVAKRVQEFRESVIYKEWSIMTEVIKIDDDQCVMKAIIISPENKVIATGHGCEFKASSQINKTSYVENCETSAIGRALAVLGLAGTEFASANEVQNAIHQQNTPTPNPNPNPNPKPSIIKATDGAGETLSEEDKQFIRDLAIEVIAAHADNDIAEAHQIYTGLNSEERVFMWTLLDSKVRRSIKDYAEAK
jgi:hypothetical protein